MNSQNSTPAQRKRSIPRRVWDFYYDGFRTMSSTGRTLWIVILIKLFIFFVIMKLFFFPDLLERDYSSDTERAQAVRSAMLDNSK